MALNKISIIPRGVKEPGNVFLERTLEHICMFISEPESFPSGLFETTGSSIKKKSESTDLLMKKTQIRRVKFDKMLIHGEIFWPHGWQIFANTAD